MAMIRRTAQEQIQLIGECRASGLTIAEWCLREGIKPDTYYSWVDRQSKKGRIEKAATIPQVITMDTTAPDIVRVEMTGAEMTSFRMMMEQNQGLRVSNNAETPGKSAVMEVVIGGVRIKVTNQIDPQLLAETIRLVGGGIKC